MNCSQTGPYLRDQVPTETFLTLWVPIYISRSLFSLVCKIKNVNSVYMYTTMSKLDLCSLKPSIALKNGLHTCSHWFCVTLLANSCSYLYLHARFHKSLFWVPILAAKVSIFSLFHEGWVSIESLFLSLEVPISC